MISMFAMFIFSYLIHKLIKPNLLFILKIWLDLRLRNTFNSREFEDSGRDTE